MTRWQLDHWNPDSQDECTGNGGFFVGRRCQFYCPIDPDSDRILVLFNGFAPNGGPTDPSMLTGVPGQPGGSSPYDIANFLNSVPGSAFQAQSITGVPRCPPIFN